MVMKTKKSVTQVWYRAIEKETGKVWIETTSKKELLKMSNPEKHEYYRLIIYREETDWEPWSIENG